MKSIRHSRILEIIAEKEIETQDELIEELKKHGFNVTQATISRDIKQLGLVKTTYEGGKYKYISPRKEPTGTESKFRNILGETVISVASAENIIVVKTFSGMANAAAAAIDSLAGNKIIGSLAGDDTIFIVVKNQAVAVEAANMIRNILGIV
ncbi:MAG: arginine repressor [Clostridia bacterium]|nr:arginine repressor [Clostridia bacterium]